MVILVAPFIESTGSAPYPSISGTQPIGGIMGRKLYVGNLPYSATEETLAAKFAECGRVESIRLITDRDTGRSKGFAFIEMASDSEAQAAIEKINGIDYDGRPMKVNEARPQEKKSGRDGGYGRGNRW